MTVQTKEKFSYEKTLKTNKENSFLNLQQYLFVTSKQLTKFFYYTKVTPHQIILLSMIFGVTASYLIIQSVKLYAVIGAVLLFYKNVLDKVDGSLARAKGLDSRRGRFYDSISDFIVTLTSFSAITYSLYMQYNSAYVIVLGFAAMIFSMLQCSYFIYYQVSFIKSTGKDTVNRILENVTEDDMIKQDKWTIFLQRVFMLIYGWQDKLFFAIDNRLIKGFADNEEKLRLWYQNKPFLTVASSLSIGTHIFLICLSAIIGRFDYYIFVNLILMNLL
ncbi:MAG TPA: CDP-alcohol phosphatidyltransferase family protein, partial [Ignavibacteria bacterium]|nr:CDP-alcohol phosphatidyltransferase family protein [Ignavibacteria bacterium]